MSNELYTIGYAPFSMEDFIATLRRYGINALVDVRSSPYSKYKPEFKKDPLNKTLADNRISYIFLGGLVGARVEDSTCYTDGILNYDLLKETDKYQTGITRILNGMKDYRIALMCAEKDPLNCHRTFLISRTLRSYPVKILHILEDGLLEEHTSLEKRLLKLYERDQPSIFHSEEAFIEDAYDTLCQKIILNE